jgi:hypothetical protein
VSVHRFWVGPARPLHEWITAAVRRAHSHVVDWSWLSLPPMLADLLDPDDDPRHLSNVARYWLLHEYGGLYLDMDVIPLRDLTVVSPSPWTAALHGRREGCVMWFPQPYHPMLAEAMDRALAASRSQPSPYRSGSHVLERVGASHPHVALEPRVIPLDALGWRTPASEVWAVKQWETSHRNLTRSGGSLSSRD